MTLNSISGNSPVVAQSQTPKAQRQTAQEAVDQIRISGEQDIARGNELKDQAAKLKAAAQAASDAAAQKIETSQNQVLEGVAQVAAGTLKQGEGALEFKGGVDAEKAANAKGSAATDAFKAGLAEAGELNAELGNSAVALGLGVAHEGFVVAGLQGKLNGLEEQQAAAAAIRTQQEANLGNLKTGLEAEKTASDSVAQNVEAFESALRSYEESSAQLRDGINDSVLGFNLNQRGLDDKNNAQVRRTWGDTYEKQAVDKADEALKLGGQSSDQFATGVKLSGEANDLTASGENNLALSDLLAQVAAVDKEAGGKLAAIPSFAQEGFATLDISDAKAQESSDKAATGQGELELAGQKSRLSDEALAKGLDLAKQSADAGKKAKKYADHASSARAEAQRLDAQGDASIAEGKTLEDQGAVKKAAGESGRKAAQGWRDEATKGIEAGFAAEAQAAQAQDEALKALGEGNLALAGNIAERLVSVAGVAGSLNKLGEIQNAEAEVVAKAGDLGDAIEANFAGREQNAADILASVSERDAAHQSQQSGLDKIDAGSQEAAEGGRNVREGKFGKITGQKEKERADKDVQSATEQDTAGSVLVEKGQKYVGIADAAARKNS